MRGGIEVNQCSYSSIGFLVTQWADEFFDDGTRQVNRRNYHQINTSIHQSTRQRIIRSIEQINQPNDRLFIHQSIK